MKASWHLRIPVVLLMLWTGYHVVFSRTPEQAGKMFFNNIFSGIDLGIHELGHVITLWAPNIICAAAGSITQCVVPLIAGFSFLRKGVLFEACFCLWWSGENMICSAYYIGDAKAMNMHLVSPFGENPDHDWNVVLSKLGLLRWDTTIAFFVRAGGTILILAGLVLGVIVLWAMRERDLGRRAPGRLGELVDRQ